MIIAIQRRGYRILMLHAGGVDVWRKANPGRVWHFGSLRQALWSVNLSASRRAA
jgi:hypothetical protein